MAAPTNLSVTTKTDRTVTEGDIFVSTNGDDKNSGTKDLPVKTVDRALELASASSKGETVISFYAGEYRISPIQLKSSRVTLSAYDGEVIFNGGVTLSPKDFQPYKDNIKVLDLKNYGVTKESIGKVRAFGQYNTAEKYGEEGNLYCEVFCADERMTLARFPNVGEDNLKTGKIIDNGDSKETYTSKGTQTNPDWDTMVNPKGGTFAVDENTAKRIAGWQNSPEIWMFGYFQYDWADSTTPLKSFDSNSVTTEYASVYGFKEGTPYYFFNVFEELDAQNEWYIDTENLLLYFYPPDDFENKSLQISLCADDLISIKDADNITFDGITFTGTRGGAVKGSGNNIKIKNCVIKNVGGNGIDLKGENITVESNTITSTGKGGVILEGGDRETLKSSGNVVTNNLIYNWSQVYQTYQPAVNLIGVNGVCSHNEIYNSPHEAIAYKGNNHVIEYNVIHDVVRKSSDAGAIYSGRSWSSCGNIIRYNCIYNIGSEEFSPSGIYFDDALSGQSAYGNVLVNIPGYGFLIGGGRNMEVTNNMIINAGCAFLYDDRAIAGIEDGGWFNHANVKEKGLWATLKEVDINSAEWKAAYPYLIQWTDDFDNTGDKSFAANPADSNICNNIVVDSKKSIGEISKRAEKYSQITDNSVYSLKDDIFTDSKNGDYTLKSAPAGFEPIPFDQIGRK